MMGIEIPDVVYGALRAEVERDMGLSGPFKTATSLTGNGGLLRPTDKYPTTQEKWDRFFAAKLAELGQDVYGEWLDGKLPKHPQPTPQPTVPRFTDTLSELQPPPKEQPAFIRPSDPKETNPKAAIGVRKVSLSVVPMDVVLEASLGMLEGAAKYGKANYLASGARASVYYDGTMRHLNQWWLGENIDPDSGLHHISKAISSLMVLRSCMLAEKFMDDRPPLTGFDMHQLNDVAACILEKHKDKNPRHYTIQDEV